MVWPFRRRERVNPMDPQQLLAAAHAAEADVTAAEADGADATGPDAVVDVGAARAAEVDLDAAAEPFRFEVEDVFVITGRGTVVTGRIGAGRISVGAAVTIERAGQVVGQSEICGIEKFRATADSAVAGENVGLLLTDLSKDDLGHGDVIRVIE